MQNTQNGALIFCKLASIGKNEQIMTVEKAKKVIVKEGDFDTIKQNNRLGGALLKKYYLAIDIGASSGRHILGSVEQGRIVLEEIYRFENRQRYLRGHDCWDVEEIYRQIVLGLKCCAQRGKIPETMAIDTWAVDFVLVSADGQRIGDAVTYRDKRTEHADTAWEDVLPFEKLYAETGIQRQKFNTVYQLLALKEEHPEQIAEADRMLMIPDYLNYLLTGKMAQEYTVASSTGLLHATRRDWDRALIRRAGLPDRLFGELSFPGTILGGLREELREELGFDCQAILSASHDTASAFLAVPSESRESVYLSSGTWSLLGVENTEPVIHPAGMAANFTNEGGAYGTYRYLKNIMGLWMLQGLLREVNGEAYMQGRQQVTRERIGRKLDFPTLAALAEEAEDFQSVVDVDDAGFLAPDSMSQAIRDYCRRSGQVEPQTVGETAQCIYRSLSRRYAEAIGELEKLNHITYRGINIVGGGCQDSYLNRLTAAATGIPVYAGPVECTALGNLLVQMIAAGEFCDIHAARAAVKDSFEIVEYKSEEGEAP